MAMQDINMVDVGLGVGGAAICGALAYPGVVSSIAIPTLALSTPVVLCGVGAAGSIYGIYKILTKEKREMKDNFKKNCKSWDLFWEDNKVTSHDLVPKFAYDVIDSGKRTIMFELPYGIYKEDIEKVSGKIKELLQVDTLDINIKKDKMYFNIRSLSTDQKRWLEFWEMSDVKSRGGEYPELLRIEEKSYGNTYIFKSPIGLSTHHLTKIDLAIQEFLGYENISFEIKDGQLFIEVITSDLPTNVPFNILNDGLEDINVILGKNQLMEDVVISLNKVHSYLIVGATGGGKSVCIHNILTQLYTKYPSPKDMLFYIADLKRVECINYKDIVNTVKYTDNVEEADKIVDELLQICEDRHELFTETARGIKNLAQYNSYVSEDKRLPYITFCIEECARLMSNNNIQKKIAELAFICRSAGIILLLTIQKPTKSLFSPDIRASMLASICFKTTTPKNSEIICGDGRLKNLRGKGDCWIMTDDLNVGEQRIQGAYLDSKDIDSYLKKYCKFK